MGEPEALKTTVHAERVRKRIERAFIELFMERGYEAITIHDIADRAEVARTTFYRYFASKPDLLLSMHAGFFGKLRLGLVSRDNWLADEPPATLVNLLSGLQSRSIYRYSMFELGRDYDLILQHIEKLLAREFEESLQQAFPDRRSAVPLPILAGSVAALYTWHLRWWMTGRQVYTAAEFAGFIHQAARAVVREWV